MPAAAPPASPKRKARPTLSPPTPSSKTTSATPSPSTPAETVTRRSCPPPAQQPETTQAGPSWSGRRPKQAGFSPPATTTAAFSPAPATPAPPTSPAETPTTLAPKATKAEGRRPTPEKGRPAPPSQARSTAVSSPASPASPTATDEASQACPSATPTSQTSTVKGPVRLLGLPFLPLVITPPPDQPLHPPKGRLFGIRPHPYQNQLPPLHQPFGPKPPFVPPVLRLQPPLVRPNKRRRGVWLAVVVPLRLVQHLLRHWHKGSQPRHVLVLKLVRRAVVPVGFLVHPPKVCRTMPPA